MSDSPFERRARQRIFVQGPGQPHFAMRVDGAELELVDLSLEGFAVRRSTPPPAGDPFAFELWPTDGGAAITGHAVAVNFLRSAEPDSGQAGCRFLNLDGDGPARLRAWLAVHVVAVSAVPMSVAEAAVLVSGPSIA
jgi:hypothetical protein